MPEGSTVTTNIPAFKKQMAEFGFDVEKNIIRAGVRAAGVIFRNRAQQLAPVSNIQRKGHVPGLLKRNIILGRPKRQTPGEERQYVSVRAGNQRGRKGAGTSPLPFYWAWVEAGHRIVPRGGKMTGGRSTKALKRGRFDAGGGARTKAVEYLKRAFQSVGGAALQAFIDRVQDRIDKENAKRTPGA